MGEELSFKHIFFGIPEKQSTWIETIVAWGVYGLGGFLIHPVMVIIVVMPTILLAEVCWEYHCWLGRKFLLYSGQSSTGEKSNLKKLIPWILFMIVTSLVTIPVQYTSEFIKNSIVCLLSPMHTLRSLLHEGNRQGIKNSIKNIFRYTLNGNEKKPISIKYDFFGVPRSKTWGWGKTIIVWSAYCLGGFIVRPLQNILKSVIEVPFALIEKGCESYHRLLWGKLKGFGERMPKTSREFISWLLITGITGPVTLLLQYTAKFIRHGLIRPILSPWDNFWENWNKKIIIPAERKLSDAEYIKGMNGEQLKAIEAKRKKIRYRIAAIWSAGVSITAWVGIGMLSCGVGFYLAGVSTGSFVTTMTTGIMSGVTSVVNSASAAAAIVAGAVYTTVGTIANRGFSAVAAKASFSVVKKKDHLLDEEDSSSESEDEDTDLGSSHAMMRRTFGDSSVVSEGGFDRRPTSKVYRRQRFSPQEQSQLSIDQLAARPS